MQRARCATFSFSTVKITRLHWFPFSLELWADNSLIQLSNRYDVLSGVGKRTSVANILARMGNFRWWPTKMLLKEPDAVCQLESTLVTSTSFLLLLKTLARCRGMNLICSLLLCHHNHVIITSRHAVWVFSPPSTCSNELKGIHSSDCKSHALKITVSWLSFLDVTNI